MICPRLDIFPTSPHKTPSSYFPPIPNPLLLLLPHSLSLSTSPPTMLHLPSTSTEVADLLHHCCHEESLTAAPLMEVGWVFQQFWGCGETKWKMDPRFVGELGGHLENELPLLPEVSRSPECLVIGVMELDSRLMDGKGSSRHPPVSAQCRV